MGHLPISQHAHYAGAAKTWGSLRDGQDTACANAIISGWVVESVGVGEVPRETLTEYSWY
jgi:hypothetical protein